MDKEIRNNIRLGFFVTLGLIFLIVSVYYIGSKKNLFSSTFSLITVFNDVNGLQTGNNVRFLGIDIGTIKRITVSSDSAIIVQAIVEEKYQPFLKKNSVASIATDGLMGNKIINIHNQISYADIIQEYDTLETLEPLEAEEALRTLNATSNNLKEITGDLKNITEKINTSHSLWNILSDSLLADNLKKTIQGIKITGEYSSVIASDLNKIINDVKTGKGVIGGLLVDTAFSNKLKNTIDGIQSFSDTMSIISGDLKKITEKIYRGEGSVGMLLKDTTIAHNLNESIESIKKSSENFNENMEALKHSFLLRKYFQEKKKIEKK